VNGGDGLCNYVKRAKSSLDLKPPFANARTEAASHSRRSTLGLAQISALGFFSIGGRRS
jgi:hypothetical protein